MAIANSTNEVSVVQGVDEKQEAINEAWLKAGEQLFGQSKRSLKYWKSW